MMSSTAILLPAKERDIRTVYTIEYSDKASVSNTAAIW
jgi:hypothetical protein